MNDEALAIDVKGLTKRYGTRTVVDRVSQRKLVDESIADEIVAGHGAPIVDAAIRHDHLVALVFQPQRKAKPGEMLRGDNESHAGGRIMA